MSVTFSGENAPIKEIPNIYFEECYPEDRYNNPRTIMESEWPELNISNTNASLLIKELSIKTDYINSLTGCIENKDLPDLMRKIIRTINSSSKIKSLTRETVELDNFISFGVDEERVFRYLTILMDLIVTCIENNTNIIFS